MNPDLGPNSNAKGNNQNIGQHGPTPCRDNQGGDERANKGTESPEIK